MAKINFGGVEETVVTREEFPLEKAKEVLKNETIAVIGYGIQGPGQGLNLRDNGFNVIVGQRKESKTWDKAVADGWIPGETLFDIEEAAERATIIEYLLSDAAQIEVWPRLKKHLTAGKALYFSLQRAHRHCASRRCRRNHGCAQRLRHIVAPPLRAGTRHQLELRSVSGCHRTRKRAMPCIGHRHRLRIYV